MSEYRPDEPSPLPQANAYVAYRKGRLDGLDGRPFEPFGTTVEELSAYRKGYGHGAEERGSPLPAWIAAAIAVVSVVALAVWWFR
jgi:hypothetical protein